MPLTLLNTNGTGNFQLVNNTNSGRFAVSVAATTDPVVTSGLVMNLDAGNVLSYPGSGSTWTDTVQSRAFTLFNSPTYNATSGGYINFVVASSQYASSATSLTSSLTTWTVETWHYYTGTNSGGSPCIVTETFPGATSRINFSLGSNNLANLQSGFFDGAWRITPAHTLTANNWYHIVGTYDGATNKLYVNNSLVQSASYAGTPARSQGGIRLMRRWDNPDYWGGRLSIVNIYTGSLNATQISQNYNANKSRFGL